MNMLFQLRAAIRVGFLFMFAVMLSATGIYAQNTITPDGEVIYKQTEEGDLSIKIFLPQVDSSVYNNIDKSIESKAGSGKAAVVFFFGGGWSGGTVKQFYQQSRFMNKLGIVAFSADYRVKSRQKTTPFESVEDAKSAIRWVREHALEYGIDPTKIVASGGSAGGHIAACTGIIKGFNSPQENSSISSIPNAMILFNPVLDTTKDGYGSEKLKGQETLISPCHHVEAGAPPTLTFHGTSDTTVPFENADRFDRLMKQAGNRSTLSVAYNCKHGFFNGNYFRKTVNNMWFNRTMYESNRFLYNLGFTSTLTDPPIETN